MDKLELLIGLKIADERTAEDEDVRRRDRAFGRREEVKQLSSDTEKVEKWFRQPFNATIREEAKRYVNTLHTFTWLAVSAFFLTGMGAAGVAFYYDGNRPINVLPILLLFVLMPFGLLLISIILRTIRRYGQPDFLGGNGIIRFWKSLLSLYAGRGTGAGGRYFRHFTGGHENLVHTFVLATIQKAGIAYVSGALLWLLINIITTDLAFSWSSTLNMGPGHMHALTETLALPWRAWLPAAVVDLETIEKTRYFRASSQIVAEGASPADLGGWWSFLLMSLLTYSFIPRLAALAFYKKKFSTQSACAILNSQEGQALLQRMETPFIDTAAGLNDNARPWEPPDDPLPGPVDTLPLSCILLWNFGEYDMDMEKVKSRFGIRNADVYSLGGLNTLAEDDQIIGQVSSVFRDKATGHQQHLILLVEYWESPDVDFEKVLKKLRAALGQKLIRIVPVAMNEYDVKESNKINWMNKIQQAGDPLLRFDPDSRLILTDYYG